MMKKQKYPTDLTDGQAGVYQTVFACVEWTRTTAVKYRRSVKCTFLCRGRRHQRGGCCRRIFRTGNRFIIIFGVGAKAAIGSGFTTLYTSWNGCARGRGRQPSAGCLDSQSVKNVGGKQEARGYDAGKKITGRKRHLLVDTIGLPIAVKVTAASESDQAGARKLFAEEKDKLENILKIWVDGTYRGEQWHKEVKETYGIQLEVKQNEPGVKGFVAVAKRWVVERTFGWLVQSRRLVREYEKLAESTQAMIHLTMIRILVRRLAPDFSD